MNVTFDARELYFLTQFLPLHECLGRRGVDTRFVAYENRPSQVDLLRGAFEATGVPLSWCPTKEDAVEHYRRERPDWIVFGRNCSFLDALPGGTRTAMLYHGTGVKTTLYDAGHVAMDVNFVSGPFYAEKIRSLHPHACVVETGYAKLDPLFRSESPCRPYDLESVGLDPAKTTVMYAPGHSPSTFPNMPDDWPEEFAEYNLIVKPHMLSYFGSARKAHRRKMDRWESSPNVYVARLEEFDPNPFMLAADLLISDASGILYEFAALGRPVVQADFVRHPLARRGLLRFRRGRRLDASIEQFADICPHARKYRDLKGVVRHALESADQFADKRRAYTLARLGPTDGRVCERIADYLLSDRISQDVPAGISAETGAAGLSTEI